MVQRKRGLEAPVTDQGRAKKDVAGTRQILELVRGTAAFAQGLVISTLPRGGIKLVQPAKLPDGLIKAYDRLVHRHDRVAWAALLKGVIARGSDCWSEQELKSSPYSSEFLRPLGLAHSLAIPLSGPLLAGYPGALILLRGAYDKDFSDTELGKLEDAGRAVDCYLDAARPARAMELRLQTDPWTHTAAVRHFVFDDNGKAVFPKKAGVLPVQVEKAVREHLSRVLPLMRRGRDGSGCMTLPDGRGEHWTFRFHCGAEYPAIGQGQVVFASLQPEAFEWVQVKPWEVAADEEFARMLPAMKFMQESFASSPGLDDIAARASLSPFHFHRRFADLVGQTPKQFLVSCQMHEAKRLLVARRHSLPEIAGHCGFSHQSHFASRFRQTTGLTPTRWRRMAAEMVQATRQDR